MKKKQRRIRTKATKVSKRSTPGSDRKRKRFLTRVEARQRAVRHVIKRMFKDARVLDGDVARHNAYNVRQAATWLVYKKLPGRELRAAEVVVVCKRTGRVLYEGSACDEG